MTLVEASLAASLGIEGESEPLELNWTANVKRREDSSQRISMEISARGGERRYLIAAAHTVKQLSLPKQQVDFNSLISDYYYLQGLPDEQRVDGFPRILIGLENVDLMAPLETRSGQPGQPIAVKSVLGWAVYGPHATKNARSQPAASFVHSVQQQQIDDSDTTLNEMLRQYFTLEKVAVTNYSEFLPEKREIVRARQLLESTTERRNDHFETGLLWKPDDVILLDSIAMATKRLYALERKLDKNEELKQIVHEQMQNEADRTRAKFSICLRFAATTTEQERKESRNDHSTR